MFLYEHFKKSYEVHLKGYQVQIYLDLTGVQSEGKETIPDTVQ